MFSKILQRFLEVWHVCAVKFLFSLLKKDVMSCFLVQMIKNYLEQCMRVELKFLVH